ncbi:MAG TPA: YidB family protein, partial [Methyloceanibacter sp.]
DTIDTWINTGANQDISSDQVSDALGRDVVDELSRRTGLSRDQVVEELSRLLPGTVDKLTPEGRLPTQREMARLLS